MKKLFLAFLLLPLLTACEDDDDSPSPADCGIPINITDTTDAPTDDYFELNDHAVTGTCLSFTISAFSCNGEQDEWAAELRTDGSIAESNPTQSNARLILDRNLNGGGVLCQGIASKTFDFNLDSYLGNALPSRLTVVGPDSTLFTVLVE